MKKKEIEDNDALNVAKLEEGLLKFSQSQLSQKNTEKMLANADAPASVAPTGKKPVDQLAELWSEEL